MGTSRDGHQLTLAGEVSHYVAYCRRKVREIVTGGLSRSRPGFKGEAELSERRDVSTFAYAEILLIVDLSTIPF